MLVRYYGHVGLPTGYGEAANETCMAILSAGLDLEISTDGKELGPRHLPLASHLRDECSLSHPDVVIVHTLPIDCAKLLAKTEIRQRFPRAVCVAYTTWEGGTPAAPEIGSALQAFDQVWVPSGETKEAIEAAFVDCEVVPHAFDPERWAWAREPRVLDTTEPYHFYYVGAWTARKNVEGVIRAYIRAFEHTDNVKLMIQSAGAQPSACQIAALSTGVDPRKFPAMWFNHERLREDEIDHLHRTGDCFVTASRGEAWCLPAFDAMLAGNHIIAPAGLGSDEFLAGTSADRYTARPAPAFGDVRLAKDPAAPPGHVSAQLLTSQGLTCRSTWLEPDIAQLSRMMREAYLHRTRLEVNYDPVAVFGRSTIGRLIKTLLEGRLL